MMAEYVKILEQREIMGKTFTIYGAAENPLFLAKEIAGWIEHSDVSTMLLKIDDHEKLIQTMFVAGQNRECWFLTEDGLYEVLMQSRKPIAKQFKAKVKEILRAIRKTGSFSTPSQQPLPACLEDLIIQQATLLKELRIKVESQQQQIDQIAHKPFSQFMNYMSCESWLRAKHIPFKRDLLWGFSRRCAQYSRENNIEIHAVGKSGYAINAYREDVLERCFGNKTLPALVSAPAPKKKVELTDCLKGWFATVPAPERLVMLENFAVWESKIPEKFRSAVLHTLTASIGKTIFEYEETKKIRRIG